MKEVPIHDEDAFATKYGIRNYPSYIGAFTTRVHPGALPNGTRVHKINSEPDDTVNDGASGTVLGSIGVENHVGYYVEWDSVPRHAIFVMAYRVKEKIKPQV